MALREYKRKRDFKSTPEPIGKIKSAGHTYCIQKHDASHLHYDLRLQVGNVLKSWAVPKGPSLDPKIKRLAIEVEDHPLEYATFEGHIPSGYGAGDVIVWDYGTWTPTHNPQGGLKKGHLDFDLHGDKLHGRWSLVRTRKVGGKNQWLLIKKQDREAKPEKSFDITESQKESVLSQQTLPRDTPFPLPQLAKLEKKPPVGEDWVHEVKFDGYRTLCHIEDGVAHFFTRNGLDWSKKYRSLAPEIRKFKVKSAWIDGEVVCLNEQGRSDFQLLQENLKSGKQPLIYYVFDLLFLNGKDLRDESLLKRKSALKTVFPKAGAPHVLLSEHWDQPGANVLANACQLGLEGIVSKQKDAPYFAGRNGSWIKTKCGHGQEFVIVGYTPPRGRRIGFGALLLAARGRNGKLTYAGRVGTGFTQRNMPELMRKFRRLERKTSPIEQHVPQSKHVQWLEPELVADIRFLTWTQDKILRHASFHGLRMDKPASAVEFEHPAKKVSKKMTSKVKLSHPDKILIPGLNVTKSDIANYYESVTQWMLPHVANRPLALVRCPDGIKKVCFFQKNLDPRTAKSKQTEVHQESRTGQNKKKINCLYIDSTDGLVRLAQMNVLEIHVWGTHRDHLLQPDQMVFDLDPGEDIEWSQIAQAAFRLKDLLGQMKLKSFVKFTGGKGLHVQAPIAPMHDWNDIKTFTKAVAETLSTQWPKDYVFNMAKSKRKNRIFIDYLRNGYGATAVAPYSLRARPEAGIAFPLAWEEIENLKPKEINLRTVPALAEARAVDPWKDYLKIKQKLNLNALR